MKVVVSTHQGILYNEEVQYIVVKNTDGEFAILNNHIPIVSVIKEGYIKLVDEKQTLYVVIINGILEFKNNEANILAQEAQVGEDYDKAKKYLEQIIKDRLNDNRKKNIDYTKTENDLKKNIHASKAGNL